MWFSDYIFLERSWAKDENTLKVNFALFSFLSLNLILFHVLETFFLSCFLHRQVLNDLKTFQ